MSTAVPKRTAPADLDAVERLAERGWRLIPCGHRSKVALLKGWPAAASSDPATLRRWAAKHPDCNWAVVTGSDSGVFVLDVDGEKGRASLAALEAEHGQLPDTLTSRTGRLDGGEHRWFNYPAGFELRGSTGKLGEGLDTRAAGGYVIVPPSIHETGRPYEWIEPQRPFADVPAWIVELLANKEGKAAIALSEPFGIFTKGRRNDGLARYGGALRRKGAELAELEEKLLGANARRCVPPLEDAEVRKIAASMTRYPVGGLDPLETAWRVIQGGACADNNARFLALCRQLQAARPGLDIALPIERIGELMGVHYTSVSNYRKEAFRRGLLVSTGQYIAHRRAGQYRYIEGRTHADPKTLTKAQGLLTNGLVRTAPSENDADSPSESSSFSGRSGRDPAEGSRWVGLPQCPSCASAALYRRNNVGKYECLTCGLIEIEESAARRLHNLSCNNLS